MLTIDQVNRMYQEGYDVRFKKKSFPGLKGEFDPGTSEILIYHENADSQYDRDITILHEFIHAREEMEARYSSGNCNSIDEEAMRTYQQRPDVLMYLKELYGIP